MGFYFLIIYEEALVDWRLASHRAFNKTNIGSRKMFFLFGGVARLILCLEL